MADESSCEFQKRKNTPTPRCFRILRLRSRQRGLDVGGAVAVKADGGNVLGEDDADGDEDGAGAGSVGDGDIEAGAFGILIAAVEVEALFGQIFADGDFFLEASAAKATQGCGP